MKNTTARNAAERPHDPLAGFLLALREGKAATHENLTLVPLFGPESGPAVTTLAEAIRAGTAEVGEIGEGGHVPTLRVKNRGPKPLLIFDGEELVGAKQNRIVNTTILVAAGADLDIPVSCVEHGRWAWRSRHFTSEGRMLKPEMRSSKNRRVAQSLASEPGRYDADQHVVWDEVARYRVRREAPSDTGAMADVYEKDRPHIESYAEKFAPLPGQTGVAAYVNGRLVALDVLGRPEAYAALHAALVRSFAAEAVDRHGGPKARKRPSLRQALRALARGGRSESPPPGLGRDIRIDAKELHGAALLADGGVVHAAAFAA